MFSGANVHACPQVFSAWPERPLVPSHLPEHVPPSFDAAVHAFEFDDPAFVERTEFGYRWWSAFEKRVSDVVRTAQAFTTNCTYRKLDEDEHAFYQKLLGELHRRKKALFWEDDAGAFRSRLHVSTGQACVQFAVAFHGNTSLAQHGIFLIPGFGPDARTFASAFHNTPAKENEAIVAASLIGAGTSVPESLEELSPRVLTDLYVQAVLKTFPNAQEITLVGNSMGAAIALAAAIKLGSEHGKKVNLVVDNTIGTHVLDDMKPWLLQAARLARWWEAGLHAALWTTLNVGPLRASLVDDWYGQTVTAQGKSVDIEPTEADLFYASSTASLPTPENAYSYAGLLAAIGVHIDAWQGYYTTLARQHGDWITTDSPSGKITGVDLHGGIAVFVDSTGNHFFPPETTDRVYQPTAQTQPRHTILLRQPGTHVPSVHTTRIRTALDIVRNNRVTPLNVSTQTE